MGGGSVLEEQVSPARSLLVEKLVSSASVRAFDGGESWETSPPCRYMNRSLPVHPPQFCRLNTTHTYWFSSHKSNLTDKHVAFIAYEAHIKRARGFSR